MNKIIHTLFLAALFINCSGPQQEKTVSLRSQINTFLKQSEFNGTAMVVDGDSTYYFTRGLADASSGRELTINDVFYLGSLAKQFTGMAVMILANEGKLDLDDHLVDHLEDLPDFCREISIRHMLNHTSGLPDYYGLGVFEPGMTNSMVVDAMQNIEKLDFEPGSAYAYSNSAYVMLSMIVESVSEMSFREFMQENVFGPLEMKSSSVYDQSRPSLPTQALGHTTDGQPDYYNAFTTGGGGIFSNIPDLEKWIQSLDEQKLVSGEMYRQAYKPAILTDGTTSYYGFGWRLNEDHPEIVSHSGSLAGFRTYMYRNRHSGTVVVLLSNYTNNVSEINAKLIELLDE